VFLRGGAPELEAMQVHQEETIFWRCKVEWVEELASPMGELDAHDEDKRKNAFVYKRLPLKPPNKSIKRLAQ
jgi:hypothetical protein